MESILQRFKDLGANRLMIAGALGALVIAALVAIIFAFSKPQMTVLFSGLTDADAGAVVTELESMDVPVKVSGDGRTIYAPSGRVPRLRMLLAEQGIPAGGAVGYELFDDKSSLGLTSFMQDMTRLRALEGELSRTIQTLDSVESSRVHLVMARRDPFSREKAEPTASVVVRMRGARSLDGDQAAAIRHLVASAVPQLSPSRVSVLDARMGAVFAEENGPMAGAASVNGLQTEIETRLARAAESVLVPTLGAGRVAVQVNADLRTEREVRRTEKFDPKDTALRSRQIIDETEAARENATEQPVTVEQNLPESQVGNVGDGQNLSEIERSESVVNYEISSERSEMVIEPGDIERLSVSVIVDNKRVTGPEGQITYEPRTEEELAKLASLVRSAVGFNEGRGDSITVENMPFVDLEDTMPRFAPSTITEVVYRNFDAITQAVALLLIGVAIIFGIIRPVMSRVIPTGGFGKDAEPIAMGELSLDDLGFAGEDEDGNPIPGGLIGAGGTAAISAPKQSMAENLDQMLELRDVDGKVRASSIRKLGRIAEQYPEEVVAILRTWIYEQEGKAPSSTSNAA
ncbi:flagellar M-ring protein FliF [Parvularcula sp. ZS-1/3]|uniref:Flagellar M-ring protein n=1 Tax=Parvularcula mediterranea TaxID=2732508 RepID=A0A7Y3RNR4_9PROT|nr:flagellar M-ring protein FliF [Parvularcula mediterranea]